MSLNPRMKKVLAEQRKWTLVIATVSSAISILSFFNFRSTIEIGFLVALTISIIAGFSFMFICNSFLMFILQKKYYNMNIEEFARDAEDAKKHFEEILRFQRAQREFFLYPEKLKIINKSDKRAAIFQDTDVYEWIEFLGSDGKVYHCTWDFCADAQRQKKLELQPGQILLQPGIIYQVETIINSAA